ncbi:hypothetical protein B0T17DRAFT_528438 [Bombardia bombarda]|uniref:Uncharacterized protein n=1 Tax=Bombardia bombarda TaxID=252184 RepID=A0AA40C9I5_9PEZI|nr:hypothetical protein B0T17DRAFT_528438 [Bombardia bombarda]
MFCRSIFVLVYCPSVCVPFWSEVSLCLPRPGFSSCQLHLAATVLSRAHWLYVVLLALYTIESKPAPGVSDRVEGELVLVGCYNIMDTGVTWRCCGLVGMKQGRMTELGGSRTETMVDGGSSSGSDSTGSSDWLCGGGWRMGRIGLEWIGSRRWRRRR